MTSAPLAHPGGPHPSEWVRRWSHLVAAGATVLDVACGSGRHVRWFAERGCRVTALDRDAAAVEPLCSTARVVVADLEAAPWPLPGERFGAVVCTNYLWRALLPALVDAVEEDGVLIYETFAAGNEAFGRPSNPDFLLRPGELLEATRGLRVIAYEDGFLDAPARCVQRVVASRDAAGAHPALPLLPTAG
jgi:SAM-dependent methyltransferase